MTGEVICLPPRRAFGAPRHLLSQIGVTATEMDISLSQDSERVKKAPFLAGIRFLPTQRLLWVVLALQARSCTVSATAFMSSGVRAFIHGAFVSLADASTQSDTVIPVFISFTALCHDRICFASSGSMPFKNLVFRKVLTISPAT
jgi:membrane-associated phospholipid phosphatase